MVKFFVSEIIVLVNWVLENKLAVLRPVKSCLTREFRNSVLDISILFFRLTKASYMAVEVTKTNNWEETNSALNRYPSSNNKIRIHII